jgi:hypothetical protein
MRTLTHLPCRLGVVFFLTAYLLSASGCGGGGGENVVAVTGRVTHKDNPVAHIVVSFVPKNQTQIGVSTGTTDEDGRYTLTVAKTGRRGAVVGPHKVWISLPREDPPVLGGERKNEREKKKKTPAPNLPPADLAATLKRYGSLERTPLSVEVTSGQPIDLKLD